MINIAISIITLFLVIKSSDIFIDHSSALAQRLKMSTFIIGFAIVSLGTSIPEFATSTYATSIGHEQLAVANILGSNIVNITLILGLLAVIKPYRLRVADIRFNIPIILISTSIAVGVLYLFNFNISYFVGILLIISFFLVLFASEKENKPGKINVNIDFNKFYLIGSVIAIFLFSKICVDSLVRAATEFSIPDPIVGYFILALGTSLPEVATLFSSIRKGQEELGIGNLLGSFVFNLFFILGAMALIKPIYIGSFIPEIIFMLAALLSVYVFSRIGKKYYFSKKEGFALIGIYLIFVIIAISYPGV